MRQNFTRTGLLIKKLNIPVESVKEHIENIKKQLEAGKNIDEDGIYDDWQAVVKLSSNQTGDISGKDIANDYINTVIADYVQCLNGNQLKFLSELAEVELRQLSSQDHDDHELPGRAGWIWIQGIEKLLHNHLFKLAYSDGGNEIHFDEEEHEMKDVLEQMGVRIYKLSLIEDERVKILAAELDRFHSMLYDYTP